MAMMGASGQARQGGRRVRRRFSPMAEINVTPMVDIMLVLLIVFMIAAPMLSVGVPVNLPKTKAAPLKSNDRPLAITVRANGDIYIEESAIALGQLVPRLKAILQNGSDSRIYVRGDEKVSYGRVAAVVARINAAGFSRVALVTDQKLGANGDMDDRENKGGGGG